MPDTGMVLVPPEAERSTVNGRSGSNLFTVNCSLFTFHSLRRGTTS
jgi:hypothetical protein